MLFSTAFLRTVLTALLSFITATVASAQCNSWAPLGAGVNAMVRAMARLPNGDIVVGGLFTTAGGQPANYVARWDGSSWHPLGSGTNGWVEALVAMPNGEVVAGGRFTAAGGVSSPYIARWNGSTWSSMGTGITDSVFALALLPNGDVAAGGNFSTGGGSSPFNHVARWDGTSWLPLGPGLNSTPYALKVLSSGDLVAGGSFQAIGGGGPVVNYVAQWNGTNWVGLGSGMSGSVWALDTLPNGDLIAGGNFTMAGGVASEGVARWNGVSWSGFGAGIPAGGVHGVAALPNGNVVVGGGFTTFGQCALWNGANWSALGGGVGSFVWPLLLQPNGDLLVGGAFTTVGGLNASCIARFRPCQGEALQAPAVTRTPPAAPLECNAGGPIGQDQFAIHRFSGEFVATSTDLSIPGVGPVFRWQRTTRSRVQGATSAVGASGFSAYDVRLVASGSDRLLSDGMGNQDRFVLQSDGSWMAPGVFRRLNQNPDTSYTLTFENRASWKFLSLSAPIAAGKLQQIVDRNGNTLELFYDASGRLAAGRDTLGRDVVLAYDTNGRVQSVTDWAGRAITYSYYQSGDVGGSPGDLKSVTTPAVVGTPNGNDFPAGKTRTYTYTKGFADPALNSDLLTITDPKGQTYLTNVYAHTIAPTDFRGTTSPSSLYYDRLVRQVVGDAGDVIDWVYEAQTPSAANNFAVLKVIENDRLGHVTESFYDAQNNEVIQRKYTGLAPNADEPTSSTLNRPGAPLRAGDPPYFETRWVYNADGLVKRVDHPEGNYIVHVFEIDLNPAADAVARGNLREAHRHAGPRGSMSQATISTFYTYQAGLAGCCGTDLVLTETDGRGGVTTHQYDLQGNRTQTIDRLPQLQHNWTYNASGQVTSHTWPALNGVRRVDAFTYHASGPQKGYLHTTVVDQGGFGLTTTYEYDSTGNVTRVVDARGNDRLFVVNELDQIVAEYSPETAPGSGIRYETLVWYDANDRVVRIDEENRDDTGALAPNTHFTTSYEHEILGNVTRVVQELTPTTQIVEEMVYDANRNLTRGRKGEATNGNQPANFFDVTYDERDLPFRYVRAPGATVQSTTQFDYDGSGNTRFVRAGLENTPRIRQFTYDGHDRLQGLIDPMGNTRTFLYDANDNVTKASSHGQLVDDQNPGPNVLLAEHSAVYDSADRVIAEHHRHFDPATGASIGDGNATTTSAYDGPSLLVQEQDDRGNVTVLRYDSAHRLREAEDALQNLRQLTYDANSNVVAMREDCIADSGAATQVFTTSYVFDPLDRQVRVTDNRGNVDVTAYDSRNHPVRRVDANGREARFEYDGKGRLLRAIRDMNGNGASAQDAADIVVQNTFDDSSRLVGRTDDNGNLTRLFYDALDRRIEERFADGTKEITMYDVHDNAVTTTDPNGTVMTDSHDLLDRLVHRVVVPGAGVDAQTTFEDYQYDGYSRGIRAQNDAAIVQRTFDSLGNVVAETLNGRTTLATFDGVGNELSQTHPGGLVVQGTYDAGNRLRALSVPSQTATFDYVGSGRIERQANSNGTRSLFEYDGYTGAPPTTGDFGVARIVRTLHEHTSGPVVLDDRSYSWDRRGNKTSRRDNRAGGTQLSQEFAHDRGDRMTRSKRSDGVVRSYTLDGANNRTNPGHTMSAQVPRPADFQVNQYTSAVVDGQVVKRVYDENGNLRGDSRRRMLYDYANQMVQHVEGSAQATYVYDPFGRRIAKTVAGTTTEYVWFGNQLIEERVAGSVVASYVFGARADVPAFLIRAGQTLVYHVDDQGNVVALTDDSGNVVERYDYRDFGQVEIFSPSGAPLAATAVGNHVLFNGRWFDPETGFHRFHTRYLDPSVGRFTTRDTIGIWGDPMGLGNGYTFVGNNPWSLEDPMGTAAGNGISGVEGGIMRGSYESPMTPQAARRPTNGRNTQVNPAFWASTPNASHAARSGVINENTNGSMPDHSAGVPGVGVARNRKPCRWLQVSVAAKAPRWIGNAWDPVDKGRGRRSKIVILDNTETGPTGDAVVAFSCSVGGAMHFYPCRGHDSRESCVASLIGSHACKGSGSIVVAGSGSGQSMLRGRRNSRVAL